MVCRLPDDPLHHHAKHVLLTTSLSKGSWEQRLRLESSFLPSLQYFHPQFMSLSTPHRLWTTAGPKPYEVAKAVVQLKFLSGQYRCGKLTRHWSPSQDGFCSHPPCQQSSTLESSEHILLECPAYLETRQNMISLFLNLKSQVSHSLVISLLLCSERQSLMQFLLDCSVLAQVIQAAQVHGECIYSDLF